MADLSKTIANLKERGFIAELADRDALAQRLAELLPEGKPVGRGGSMTVEELGVVPVLEAMGRIFVRADGGQDYLLTGSNAITEDGKLVNVDGTGNRVAAMIYQTGTIVVVAGRNKVVPNVDAALERIKNVAAPMNAKRLHRNTPCVRTGRCMDCSSPDRICRATVIQTNPSRGTKVHVILLEQDLGY